MLTAFCAAFKDVSDATLVFKLGHHEYQTALNDMLMCMARMPPFQCRVILLQGYMEGVEFERLIAASTFVVNASHGEGQCLPLMEFLSCGKPAIAPMHSAMLDYIDEQIAFVVDSWLDASAWSTAMPTAAPCMTLSGMPLCQQQRSNVCVITAQSGSPPRE